MATTSRREVDSSEHRSAAARVLAVGTFGGGGIHRYVDEQRAHVEGVDLSTYDMKSSPGGEGVAWFVASLLASLLAALRFPFRRPPDIVHVHASASYSFYRAAGYVLFAAHVWRRPVVLHVHGSTFDEFVETDSRAVGALQSLVFRASDRIVVLSPYWREVLSPHVAPEKLRVLPNAVDPGEYEPSFGGSEPRVVFVSNLVERKGVAELVEAVDRLSDGADPGFAVEIAGDGPLADEVRALAARHDHVTYHGYVSEERKRELLDRGSIFVLPTYAEGLPIAMLEAMAGGNAIVSTPVGAIPEVVGEGNGRLVEPGEVDSLVAGVSDLVASPELVVEMGRRNRRAIEDEYSWDAVADELVDLYAELVEREGNDSRIPAARRPEADA